MLLLMAPTPKNINVRQAQNALSRADHLLLPVRDMNWDIAFAHQLILGAWKLLERTKKKSSE